MFLNVYEYKLYIYIYVCVLYIQFANLNLSALNQPRLPERLAPSRLILPYRERKIGFSFCLGQNVHTKSRLLPWSLGKRVWWSRPSRLPLRCAACWKLQYQRFQADTAQWLRHCQACELGSCFHRQVQQRVERQSQSFSGVAGQWARMDLMMCRFIALFQTTLTVNPNAKYIRLGSKAIVWFHRSRRYIWLAAWSLNLANGTSCDVHAKLSWVIQMRRIKGF